MVLKRSLNGGNSDLPKIKAPVRFNTLSDSYGRRSMPPSKWKEVCCRLIPRCVTWSGIPGATALAIRAWLSYNKAALAWQPLSKVSPEFQNSILLEKITYFDIVYSVLPASPGGQKPSWMQERHFCRL
jgi:hypothetical protein